MNATTLAPGERCWERDLGAVVTVLHAADPPTTTVRVELLTLTGMHAPGTHFDARPESLERLAIDETARYHTRCREESPWTAADFRRRYSHLFESVDACNVHFLHQLGNREIVRA